MRGKNPITQISPTEFFSKDKEPLPDWLKNHQAGTPVRIANLWTSRVVYNPGAGIEGPPIRVFNTAHAAHIFVYVDYGFSKEVIDRELSSDAFRGYHLHHQQEVTQNELSPCPPRYHLTVEEQRYVTEQYTAARITTENPFAILKIYERDGDLGEEHGAWRFAVLYLGADAIATYDVLFGNANCTPYACVVDSYGFDGSYQGFDRGSLIEKIAVRTNRLPKYLLCAKHCKGWNGYGKLLTVSGTKRRFIWIREDIASQRNELHMLRDLDEDLKNIITFSDKD